MVEIHINWVDIVLKGLNLLVFVSLILTGTFLFWKNNYQVGFDLFVIAAIYIIFNKLEKLS